MKHLKLKLHFHDNAQQQENINSVLAAIALQTGEEGETRWDGIFIEVNPATSSQTVNVEWVVNEDQNFAEAAYSAGIMDQRLRDTSMGGYSSQVEVEEHPSIAIPT